MYHIDIQYNKEFIITRIIMLLSLIVIKFFRDSDNVIDNKDGTSM